MDATVHTLSVILCYRLVTINAVFTDTKFLPVRLRVISFVVVLNVTPFYLKLSSNIVDFPRTLFFYNFTLHTEMVGGHRADNARLYFEDDHDNKIIGA